LISKKHKNDNVFICQALHSKDGDDEKACLKKFKTQAEDDQKQVLNLY